MQTFFLQKEFFFNMLKNRFLFIILLTISTFIHCAAQDVKVTALLDSNRIIIGDQLQLHLTITAPIEKSVAFAPSEKWALKNCEVVEEKSITKKIEGKQALYNQDVILTSFDTGVALIAPIPLLENDSIILAQTEALQFFIDSLPVFVDTNLAFKDIKSPMDGKDIDLEKTGHNNSWWKVLLWIVIIAALLVAGGYYIKKYALKYWRERKAREQKMKLKINAGSVALSSLKELKHKKLWQKGQVKDYYSELSMILRTYIDNQWDINAKEMVTPEIMEAISDLDIEDHSLEELKVILETADLAKFAKWQPQIEENERSIKNASTFVQSTDSVEKAKMAEQNLKK